MKKNPTVLVTGSSGYVGSQVVRALAAEANPNVVAFDVRDLRHPVEGVTYVAGDIRDEALAEVLNRFHINTVVHLAAIVSGPQTGPGPRVCG